MVRTRNLTVEKSKNKGYNKLYPLREASNINLENSVAYFLCYQFFHDLATVTASIGLKTPESCFLL